MSLAVFTGLGTELHYHRN